MKSLAEHHKDMESVIDGIRLTVSIHAHEFILIQQFLKDLGREEGYFGTYASLGFEYGRLTGVIVQVHLMKEESFKAVTPIIEYFLGRGWIENGQDEDVSWGYRELRFKKMHNDPILYWPTHKEWVPKQMTATIRTWPHPQSQVCDKVEDGTETKYKYVCKEV